MVSFLLVLLPILITFVQVLNLLEAYKHYAKYATQALKAANLPKNMKVCREGVHCLCALESLLSY